MSEIAEATTAAPRADSTPDSEQGPVSAEDQISCVGVRRRFGHKSKTVEALGPVDLNVPAGQFICVVGPSGCGKSTLLRIIAGLANPSEGEIRIRVRTPSPMAMVFQDYGVYPWKRVAQNVRFGLDCAGVDRAEANRRVADWLERTQLSDFANAWPDQLSGGMRQRVALARALVTEPEILLMDEPFAALDPQLRRVMQDELLSLTQRLDVTPTVVMVTHSLSEALVLSDRIILLSKRPGRVLIDRTLPFGRPRGPEVRDDPRFSQLEQELWHTLHDEVLGEAGRSGT